MQMKHILSAGFGALALVAATAAQAAPLSIAGGAVAPQAGVVEKTHWHGGYGYYDHYPRHYYRHHYYKPYYYNYYYYPRHHHHRYYRWH